jgi:hypothetical protein
VLVAKRASGKNYVASQMGLKQICTGQKAWATGFLYRVLMGLLFCSLYPCVPLSASTRGGQALRFPALWPDEIQDLR